MSVLSTFSLRLAALAGLALLSACSSPTEQYVPFPEQTVPVKDPAKARVYLMRPSSKAGAISTEVRDNGERIGTLGPRSYLCWEREPGNASITTRAENSPRVDVPVVAGQVYYLSQTMYPGFLHATTGLEKVSQEAGRDILRDCLPPVPITAAEVQQEEAAKREAKEKESRHRWVDDFWHPRGMNMGGAP